MPWPQIGATQYHAQLRLLDKGRAIKGLVVCNNWDQEPLDMVNSLALGCYQPSPEVLIVYYYCILFLSIQSNSFVYLTVITAENKESQILRKGDGLYIEIP